MRGAALALERTRTAPGIIEAELARHEKEPSPNEVAEILLPQLTEAQVRQVAREGLVPRIGALMAGIKRMGDGNATS